MLASVLIGPNTLLPSRKVLGTEDTQKCTVPPTTDLDDDLPLSLSSSFRTLQIPNPNGLLPVAPFRPYLHHSVIAGDSCDFPNAMEPTAFDPYFPRRLRYQAYWERLFPRCTEHLVVNNFAAMLSITNSPSFLHFIPHVSRATIQHRPPTKEAVKGR